jgi:hypothetical protein
MWQRIQRFQWAAIYTIIKPFEEKEFGHTKWIFRLVGFKTHFRLRSQENKEKRFIY